MEHFRIDTLQSKLEDETFDLDPLEFCASNYDKIVAELNMDDVFYADVLFDPSFHGFDEIIDTNQTCNLNEQFCATNEPTKWQPTLIDPNAPPMSQLQQTASLPSPTSEYWQSGVKSRYPINKSNHNASREEAESSTRKVDEDSRRPNIMDVKGKGREMIYWEAVMRPVNLGPEIAPAKRKRKNVKISNLPHTTAARQRRERVSERLRVLRRLVPGGTKMDIGTMLEEACNYLNFLKSQLGSSVGVINPNINMSIHSSSCLPYVNQALEFKRLQSLLSFHKP